MSRSTSGDGGLLLEAGGGLCLVDDGSRWSVAWTEPDWLGPVGLALEGLAPPTCAGRRPTEGEDDLGRWRGLALDWKGLSLPLATSVRAYVDRPLLVFRTETSDPIEGLATGVFDRPRVAWPRFEPAARAPSGAPAGVRGYGHQYTEFAFPTLAGPDLDDFLHFPHRPSVRMPLWLNAPDGRSLMLAPLDAFHDQVIAVPRDASEREHGVRCGWHGDVARVPAGAAREVALFAGPGPRGVLEDWAAALRARHGTRRPSRHADAHLAKLSYWTDNGGAYWYRSEPGRDVASTLEAVARELAEGDVPVEAFQLDSWFYRHRVSRPLNAADDVVVPPTGMITWEPREDMLPDGVPALRERLGNPPLVTHSRHFSSDSPYFADGEAWVDGDRAHPRDPAFFERLIAQAASWGVQTFEQDWLVEMFLGVRGLREEPGRARAWQRAVDAAAARHGLTLQWCMATPADFFQTLELDRVASIRTSGDYRYLGANADNWVRFLYTNALARALGLWPFKDVFLSDASADGLDGDPLAEAEALLSALSAGPVGIGDRVGRSDRALLLRTCREDGVLVKPDVPLAAIDRCLRRDTRFEPEPLVAETFTDHPAGRWVYVVAMNAWRGGERLELELPLSELGDVAPRDPVIAYDWATGEVARVEPGGRLAFALEPNGWSLRVLCPLLPTVPSAEVALFGDVSLYASVGDTRLRRVRVENGAVAFDLLGRPGEFVEVCGTAAAPFAAAECRVPATGTEALPVRSEPDGRWSLAVSIPESGWCDVRLALP